MSNTPTSPMIRKAALAALYHLRDAYLSARIQTQPYDQQEALRNKSLQVLTVLTQLVHGKPQDMHHTFLCDVCLSRHSEHVVRVHDKKLATWCCTPCRDQLQAEGKDVNGGTNA